ncbi:Na(+)/H(+) antiporter subunit F1 [Aciduricibacillus chroicocephali]|uniref:Na(+)/H(+) antiporter subunit F1 n=1 Tax=Aciduricibacillus chroicocephali TaxID=3054939 RepID=A0ABY9KUV3_9BACI|nr:Na(+)/H(+) antiporter subunit F1 [Bacillaceae bacterium 44XB]
MINYILIVSVTLFTIAIALALLRIILGPTIPDRVVAMDMMGVNVISVIATVTVLFKTKAFLESILVIGLLAFISTIALSRFIERGVIIEHKRNQ